MAWVMRIRQSVGTGVFGPKRAAPPAAGRRNCDGSEAVVSSVHPATHRKGERETAMRIARFEAGGRVRYGLVEGGSATPPDGAPIVMPAGCERVDYEGELVVVIGRRCSRVSVEDALIYVLGYTCGNDVSARDRQRGDQQWFRGKSSDTFGPLGPWIVDGLDPTNLELRTRLNGKEVQHCNTGEMINSVAEQISFVSRVVALEPGDVIFTGTSGQPQALKPGDVVEVEGGGGGRRGF